MEPGSTFLLDSLMTIMGGEVCNASGAVVEEEGMIDAKSNKNPNEEIYLT